MVSKNIHNKKCIEVDLYGFENIPFTHKTKNMYRFYVDLAL